MTDQAVTNFLSLVRKANSSGTKEIRMSMKEAADLAVSIAMLTNMIVHKQKEVDEAHKLFSENLVINGGKLKK